MKLVASLLAGAFVGGLVAAPPPPKVDKKKNEDLIVGTWEMTKSTGNGLPKEAVYHIEFTKDGKMFFRIVQGETKHLQYEARYKLEGDKQDRMPYESITPGFDHKETSKILKLTEDEFAIEDPEGVVEEFKRVKVEKKKDEKKGEEKKG
jgi:uncharacterized protein (TIGR03066 family)